MNSFKQNTPFAKIKILGREERELEALLDTEAARTVIPLNICEELGLKAEGMTKVHGICCETVLPVFKCDIELAGQKFNNQLILGSQMLLPILGRDLIQNFKLDLDWKKQNIQIKDPLKPQQQLKHLI